MARAEIEWKAAAIFRITRAVIKSDPEFVGEVPASYKHVSEKGKEVLRRAAERGIGVINKAWDAFWGKRKKLKLQSYRSPYRSCGLHPSKSLRGRA